MSCFFRHDDVPFRMTETIETNKYSKFSSLQPQNVNKRATDYVVNPSESWSFDYDVVAVVVQSRDSLCK